MYGYSGTGKGKYHFFCNHHEDRSSFTTVKTLNDKLIDIVTEDCVSDYAELMDKLESETIYSPVDHSKDEYISYDLNTFLERIKRNYWGYIFK
jgi:hypothetical protein